MGLGRCIASNLKVSDIFYDIPFSSKILNIVIEAMTSQSEHHIAFSDMR